MQFYVINIYKIVIFRLDTIYNKAIKTGKNRRYYRKCSNNFAANYKLLIGPQWEPLKF